MHASQAVHSMGSITPSALGRAMRAILTSHTVPALKCLSHESVPVASLRRAVYSGRMGKPLQWG